MKDLKYYNRFKGDNSSAANDILQIEDQEYPVVSCIATEEIGEDDYLYEVKYAKKKDYSELPFGIYTHSSTRITLTWNRDVFGLTGERPTPGTTHASTTIYRKVNNSDQWIETTPTQGGTSTGQFGPDYYTMIYLSKGSTLWLKSTGLSKYKLTRGIIGPSVEPTKTHGIVRIESTGPISILGNILSLVLGQDFNGSQSTYTGTDSAFRGIFSALGKSLLSARHLILPNASANMQFMNTFSNCSLLSEPPVLPYSGTLSDQEYQEMFSGCKSLSYLSTHFTIDSTAVDPVKDMMKDVGNSGTFRKNPDLSSEDAAEIVPSGWSIVDNTD